MIVLDYIGQVFLETWHVLIEASPYVLFGLFAGGILYALFPKEKIHTFLGRRSFGSVLKASLLGIPLPLCSCGVIPAAMALWRRGASRGATASFLISTPETGAESIALTYGLLGPFMAVVRPVAALITSATAGLLVNTVDRNSTNEPPRQAETCPSCGTSAGTHQHSFFTRIGGSLRYMFTELLGDIGGWLLLGMLLSGLIAAFVPADFFRESLGPDWVTMLLMLVIGLPMYICASASTPVAAMLMLKGVSPGAALILLMVGPATNMSTMLIVSRELGKKTAVIYVASIIVCSLLIAFAVNALAAGFNMDFAISFAPEHRMIPLWIGISAAVILLGFIFNHYRKKYFIRKPTCSCETETTTVQQ